MNNQGLIGALYQYWVTDMCGKPRLYRRNTFFEDHKVSNYQALKIGLAVSVLAIAIIVFWSLVGVLL